MLIRLAIDKGQLYGAGAGAGGGISASVNPLAAVAPCMGTGTNTSMLSGVLHGAGHTTTARQNRIVYRVIDNGTTNTFDLLSAEWLDDQPRALAIRNDGVNFSADLARPDGTIDAGVAQPVGTWKGRSAPGSPVIGGNGSASNSTNNRWAGQLADWCYVNRHVTDAELSAFAQGRDPQTLFGANLVFWYPMQGPSNLTATVGGLAALTTTLVGSDWTLAAGRPLSGARDATKGVAVDHLIEGYVAGQPWNQWNSSQFIPIRITNIGATATRFQARLVRLSNGSVVQPWTRVTASPLAGGASVETALLCPPSSWGRIEVRREDDIEIRTAGRACGVGQKFVLDGQSQIGIFSTDRASDTALQDLAFPGQNSVLAWTVQRGGPSWRCVPSSGILRTRGELSAGMMVIGKVLTQQHPDRCFHIIPTPLAGTSRREYYLNQQWSARSNGANPPGTGNIPGQDPAVIYPIWGDNVTRGSGWITDMLLWAGKDLSFIWTMVSVTDSAAIGVHFDACYAGANMDGNGSGDTGPPTRSWVTAGLAHGVHVAVIPHDRGVSNGNPRTTSGINTQAASINSWRQTLMQRVSSPPAGITTSRSFFSPDKVMASLGDTFHQDHLIQRGNYRMGVQAAFALLRLWGQSTCDNPTITGAVLDAGKTKITVSTNLPNGGTIVTGDGRADVSGWRISTDGGSTYADVPPADVDIVGSTFEVNGSWGAFSASQIRIAFARGGPVNEVGTGSTAFAAENGLIDGLPYETFAPIAAFGEPGVPFLFVNNADGALTPTQA